MVRGRFMLVHNAPPIRLNLVLSGKKLGQLTLQVGRQSGAQSFSEFDHYIADETVAHDHVGFVGEEVHSFHVANEVKMTVPRTEE